jgi:glycosyltransferase involved in cell wall biosynthesis
MRWLVAIALCFGSGFGWTLYQKKMHTNRTPLAFSPTAYPLKNRSFVIAIIARNQGATIDKTIQSVLSQNYEPFRVVYIDDGSTDGSDLHAQDVIYSHGESHRTIYLHNAQPLGMVLNLARVAENCFDDEIIVTLEGDDLLAHEWVLQRLNQYYAHPDLWATCANALQFPTFSPVETSLYPLKTFYAALFKRLNNQETLTRKEYDFTYIEPMFELAKGHVQHLPEILCLLRTLPSLQERKDAYTAWKEQTTPLQPIERLFPQAEFVP